MKRLDLFIFALILATGILLRLYKFENPITDWHSWRQVDTSAVSRNFVKNGFDILHPKFHDLSNVPSGLDNPKGYRFVEFPLLNIAQAGLYVLFNTFTLEQWGRLVIIFSSVFTSIFIYLLVKKYADVTTALFSSFFYAVLPFNVYYGRAILPDQAMVSVVMGGIYFFDKWIQSFDINELQKLKLLSRSKITLKHLPFFVLSIIFTAAALLIKPYALFFTLPMIYLAWRKLGLKMVINLQLWFFLFSVLLPLVLWRLWIAQYPEGIPVSDWLFNKGNIRFKGAFFYWIFADRIGRLILGNWGVALLVMGILVNSAKNYFKKNGFIFYVFLISSLLYITVIAGGNVQHDYYQILIVPTIAMFLGIGAKALVFPNHDFVNPVLSKTIFILVVLFMLGFSWYFVRDYYNLNQSIVIAGKEADRVLPGNAKVIAPMEGDTTFLYYINRSGWASFQNPLPEMIRKGATHLVLLNPSETDYEFAKHYLVLSDSREYLILDLRKQP